MKTVRFLCTVIICVAALLALGGCGTGTAAPATTPTPTPTNPAPTVTLAASPSIVVANGSTTLTWTSTNATSVSIDQGVGAVAASGQTTVKSAQTTTYTITAQGAGGSTTATVTVTVSATPPPPPTVTITATPAAVPTGGTAALNVTAANATSVVISDNLDTITFPLTVTGGTQNVTVTQTIIYTATAIGLGGTTTATVTVKIAGSVKAVNHVLFLMQENRSFDTYFGMLNPFRAANHWDVGDDGNTYKVDGIDDKLSIITNPTDSGNPNVPQKDIALFKTTSTCLDDMTSAWLESYGDVNRFDPSVGRAIKMDGFVHVAENFEASNLVNHGGSGTFTGDPAGKRAMAYYDQGFLNYYYFMASQFAVSDRWFSPFSSKSTPNRIATMTGGTTLGLVRDPFVDDKLPPLIAKTIFQQLDEAKPPVSWKIYYSEIDSITLLPDTTFSGFSYAGNYIKDPVGGTCASPFELTGKKDHCIDASHIVPLSQLTTDMASEATMPSFAYIEAEYGVNDEHPGSGQSVLTGQIQAANIINSVMASAVWPTSVFFLSYDEGGGPYDHVPPVPGHSNDNTKLANMGFLPLGTIPELSASNIAVNPGSFDRPCLADGPPLIPGGEPTATAHCDLKPSEPGITSGDAPLVDGFAAQLGFRLPNIVISPFTRKHYVSHVPMDHTAVLKFVENRFIGPAAHLTNRDAAQPDLLDFFDFTAIPWATPPTPPAPVTNTSLGRDPCTPANMGP